METLILIIHIIASIALILFILLQSGKGGGVSAAFGGGAGAALGQRSAATVLGKVTVISAITFGITSMSLAVLSTQDRTTDGMTTPAPIEKSAPETPQAATAPATDNATEPATTAPAPTAPGTAAPTAPSAPAAPAAPAAPSK